MNAIVPSVFPFFDAGRYAFSLGVEEAGHVWLSGHSASRHDPATDRIIAGGTLGEQAAISHAKQRLLLEAAGLDFGHVTRVTDFVTPEGLASYPELRAARAALYGSAPPTLSTVVVNSLLRPDALLETEVVAARGLLRRFGATRGAGAIPAAAAVEAGGLIECSAILPLEEDGRIAARTLREQTERVYQTAAQALTAAGASMREVIRTVEFVHVSALDQYRDTARVRAAYLGAPGEAAVAATGIPMRRLAHPEALIQVEFTACRDTKAALNPGWERYRRLTYAPAVRAGRFIAVSGHVAADPLTNEVEHAGDIAGQARAIYETIRAILAEAGCGLDRIVKTSEYVTPAGLRDYRATAAVRRQIFGVPYPAATGVVCERLLRPDTLIEIDCWAVLPED